MHRGNTATNAFTLIELSIVLVIIGLIVGGVLVGKDLIRAAAVRAQISQIERYQAAANTFKGKFSYLPGDIKDPEASSFGFAVRGAYAGQGDGNGSLEGNWTNIAQYNRIAFVSGENAMFWVDLSQARLIGESFNKATSVWSGTPSASPADYMPEAKIGGGNYVIAYSDSYDNGTTYGSLGVNYFGLQTITFIDDHGDLSATPTFALSVQQAFSIDKKVDDGFPQSGTVKAQYAGRNLAPSPVYGGPWASGTSSVGVDGPSDNSATAGSPTTCYDNTNTAGAMQQYSVGQKNGAGFNCALRFQFQ
jgi:prepilin-type N-terminal cleavage/methylation domain-containing protein